MVLNQKYIKTKDKKIIVFSELLEHKQFRDFEPISAGFISIGATMAHGYPETSVSCYGESVTLNLKANEEEDSELARKQILGQL